MEFLKKRASNPFAALAIVTLLTIGQVLNGCGESETGPKTDPNAQIILQEPVGGEHYAVGDSLRIRWKLQGDGVAEISSVKLLLSPDSGKTWILMVNKSIAVGDKGWADYKWKIEAGITNLGITHVLAGNDKVMLRIQDYTNTSDPNKKSETAKAIVINAK